MIQTRDRTPPAIDSPLTLAEFLDLPETQPASEFGGGTAYWKFNLDDHRLDIRFRSLSHYHLETHGTGKGTSGMLRRLSAIGGTLRIAIDTSGETSTTRERPIRIQINAPLGQAGTR